MEYNIKLIVPAIFSLGRILKNVGIKEQVTQLLNSDLSVFVKLMKTKDDEENKKDEENEEDQENEKAVLKLLDTLFDVFLSITSCDQKIEKDFYSLFAQVSNVKEEDFLIMEIDDLYEFFKSFKGARGLKVFFDRALKSKG